MSKPIELAGLTARIVGPDNASLTAVLLHGFGAPGDDLGALSQVLDGTAPPFGGAAGQARPAVGPSIRYVFPEAPLALGAMFGNGRAWWELDLVRMEREMRTGQAENRRFEVPDGLPEVRAQLLRFLDELAAPRVVLGGFSQGAMLSLDVALHREAPLAGVVLMSGTLIAEPEWQPRFAKLAGVPVFQSHGRADSLLPFAAAEVLRDHLRTGGAALEWHPFMGGHEIPRAVLAALNSFLAARTSAR